MIITDQTMPQMTGDLLAKEAMRIKPGLPVVFGDRRRLLEVMQNLIDNAERYGRSSKDRTIRIDRLAPELSRQLRLVVSPYLVEDERHARRAAPGRSAARNTTYTTASDS